MKKSLFTITLLPAMLLVACGGTKITAEEFVTKATAAAEALNEKYDDADVTSATTTATVKNSYVCKGLSALGFEDESLTETGKFKFTMNFETDELTADPDEDDSELDLLYFAEDNVFTMASHINPTGVPEGTIVTCYSNPLRIVGILDVEQSNAYDGTTKTHMLLSYTFDSDGIISKVQVEESYLVTGTIDDAKINGSQTFKNTVSFSKTIFA